MDNREIRYYLKLAGETHEWNHRETLIEFARLVIEDIERQSSYLWLNKLKAKAKGAL